MFKPLQFDTQDPIHVLGGLALLAFGVRFFKSVLLFAYKTLLASPLDLAKFKGKWAVITGATDGIGKAYAFAVAKKGLNVVLVSRTQSKLDSVASEIRDKHNVDVKTIAVDFIKDDAVDYKIKIAVEIEGLQVAVLINNVGKSYSFPARFLEIEGGTDDVTTALVKCNIESVNAMTSLILPQMVERKSGVVINVSSLSGATNTPLYTVYSGTKAYVDFFSRGLAIEYQPLGITVQCLLPGYVVSKMSKIRKPTLIAPYPHQFVASALARLGVESRTTGYWSHDIMLCVLTSLLPAFITDSLTVSNLTAIRKRALKKMAQKAD